MRLDRLLAGLGYGTRNDIRRLARQGQIAIDGQPLRDPSCKIVPDAALSRSLRISGEVVDPLPGMVILMHKPAGVTCSRQDAGPLVYDLLPDRWRARKPALSTIGRLDKETSGLLLLTDDGDLLHRIISPRAKIAKVYRAILARPVRGDAAEIFAAGKLTLAGDTKPLLPAALTFVSTAAGDKPEVVITIHEGRYHQVRRMFAAIGNHVDGLHRERIGGLALPADLLPGTFRLMSAADVALIFA